MIDKGTRVWLFLMRFGRKMGCHQMAERSFYFKGYQFPVCARCTGVIIGEIFAVILIALSLKINMILNAVMVIPLALDGGLQYVGIWKSNNLRRVITGILAGIGLTFLYFWLIQKAVGFFE